MKRCTDCKYCVVHDFGYSNYTVEGTDIECLLNKNPYTPFDHWYGEESKLTYAEQCSEFTEGDAVMIYVEDDQEDVIAHYKDDPARLELLKNNYFKIP